MNYVSYPYKATGGIIVLSHYVLNLFPDSGKKIKRISTQ
jgi:hypothetical protein